MYMHACMHACTNEGLFNCYGVDASSLLSEKLSLTLLVFAKLFAFANSEIVRMCARTCASMCANLRGCVRACLYALRARECARTHGRARACVRDIARCASGVVGCWPGPFSPIYLSMIYIHIYIYTYTYIHHLLSIFLPQVWWEDGRAHFERLRALAQSLMGQAAAICDDRFRL